MTVATGLRWGLLLLCLVITSMYRPYYALVVACLVLLWIVLHHRNDTGFARGWREAPIEQHPIALETEPATSDHRPPEVPAQYRVEQASSGDHPPVHSAESSLAATEPALPVARGNHRMNLDRGFRRIASVLARLAHPLAVGSLLRRPLGRSRLQSILMPYPRLSSQFRAAEHVMLQDERALRGTRHKIPW